MQEAKMDSNILLLALSPSTIEGYSEEHKKLVFGDYASQLGEGGIKAISDYYHLSQEYVSMCKKLYESKYRT